MLLSQSIVALLSMIAVKEMIASCVGWGRDWRGKHITKSDNESTVHVLKHRSCKDEMLMHMLHCLFFIEVHFGSTLVAEHISGVHNELADVTLPFSGYMQNPDLSAAGAICIFSTAVSVP